MHETIQFEPQPRSSVRLMAPWTEKIMARQTGRLKIEGAFSFVFLAFLLYKNRRNDSK